MHVRPARGLAAGEPSSLATPRVRGPVSRAGFRGLRRPICRHTPDGDPRAYCAAATVVDRLRMRRPADSFRLGRRGIWVLERGVPGPVRSPPGVNRRQLLGYRRARLIAEGGCLQALPPYAPRVRASCHAEGRGFESHQPLSKRPAFEAVARTLNEAAGSFLRVVPKSVIAFVSRGMPVPWVVTPSRSGGHLRDRAATLLRRLCATASPGSDGLGGSLCDVGIAMAGATRPLSGPRRHGARPPPGQADGQRAGLRLLG